MLPSRLSHWFTQRTGAAGSARSSMPVPVNGAVNGGGKHQARVAAHLDRLQPVPVFLQVFPQALRQAGAFLPVRPNRGHGLANGGEGTEDDGALVRNTRFRAQGSAQHAAHAANHFRLRRLDDLRIVQRHHHRRQRVETLLRRLVLDRGIAEPRLVSGFGTQWNPPSEGAEEQNADSERELWGDLKAYHFVAPVAALAALSHQPRVKSLS